MQILNNFNVYPVCMIQYQTLKYMWNNKLIVEKKIPSTSCLYLDFLIVISKTESVLSVWCTYASPCSTATRGGWEARKTAARQQETGRDCPSGGSSSGTHLTLRLQKTCAGATSGELHRSWIQRDKTGGMHKNYLWVTVCTLCAPCEDPFLIRRWNQYVDIESLKEHLTPELWQRGDCQHAQGPTASANLQENSRMRVVLKCVLFVQK